jgi:hypothetical protein
MTFDKHSLASGAMLAAAILLLVFAAACGGGSSSSSNSSSNSGNSSSSSSAPSAACGSSTSNCAVLTVNAGPTGVYVNGAFVDVTVCGTSCTTVSSVLVDTGSVGLRVLKSAVSGIGLTQSTATGGGALVECYPFVASYMWGPVATAKVEIAGETASSTPIMLVDDSTTPAFAVPSACSNYGGTSLTATNTQASLGANGILGIGNTQQDCGGSCALSVSQQTDSSGFYGLYYACSSSSSCTGTAVSTAAQVPNPVSRFTADNNGTVISLPSISSSGAVSLAGALYFGIGTQSNNAMPSAATVLALDPTYEQFITTSYKSTTNTQSYIDSGSNGYFFDDSTIPACSSNSVAGSDWFCPSSTLTLSATNSGSTGSSGSNTASFSIANTDTLFNNNGGADYVFNDLGGPGSTGTFDWGLPFFFGRAVYNGIELKQATNSAGTAFVGPFVAY